MKEEPPTKKDVRDLIEDLQQWQEKIDKATMWHPGEPMVMMQVPDVSQKLSRG